MQATPSRPAVVGGSRHQADELASRDPLAGADCGINRFVGRTDGAVADRDHASAGEHPGVDDDAFPRGEDGFAGVGSQIDPTVAGLPRMSGRRERSRHLQLSRQRRMRPWRRGQLPGGRGRGAAAEHRDDHRHQGEPKAKSGAKSGAKSEVKSHVTSLEPGRRPPGCWA
jgi:hypothetical protein